MKEESSEIFRLSGTRELLKRMHEEELRLLDELEEKLEILLAIDIKNNVNKSFHENSPDNKEDSNLENIQSSHVPPLNEMFQRMKDDNNERTEKALSKLEKIKEYFGSFIKDK